MPEKPKNADNKRSGQAWLPAKRTWRGKRHELSQAAQLYGKGLEAVEPWAFMDLTTNAGGSSVNVPIELYNAYVNVFSGMGHHDQRHDGRRRGL